MNEHAMTIARAAVAVLLGVGFAAGACAQTPASAPATALAAPAEVKAPQAAPPAAGDTSRIGELGWLAGCWRGEVNKREFLEHWLPLRGDLLIGVSHTVMGGQTLDYEYLRVEKRGSDVYYVTAPPGKPEVSYRLTAITKPNDADTLFEFANPAETFPQKIAYRRGIKGWLFAEVDGKVDGAEKKVIYPMRRVSCESGELITN
jgi:hypothetical protein